MVTRFHLYIIVAEVTGMHVHTPVAMVNSFHGSDKAWIARDVTGSFVSFLWFPCFS
jgi:hypothetical protein